MDPFYSDLNMTALLESIQQEKEGKIVIKTLEELRQMESAIPSSLSSVKQQIRMESAK